MTSVLKTVLLAGTAALAIQLGAIAAHAGDLEDLLAAQQACGRPRRHATGGDNLVSECRQGCGSEEPSSTP